LDRDDRDFDVSWTGNGRSDELAEALLYGSTVGRSSFQAIGSAKVFRDGSFTIGRFPQL
jgi:hypothetical protein